MKLQVLPNWCKKLGLAVFFIFSIISGYDDTIGATGAFYYGWNSAQPCTCDQQIETSEYTTPPPTQITTFKDFFGAKILRYIDALSIFGILMYMLSKEKIEDDYINQLRLESYQLTAIIGIVISILLYAFAESKKLTPDYFITLFMYLYLITFFIKKRIY